MNNSELSKLIKICNIDPKQTKDEISQNIKLYFDTHNDIGIILDVLLCKTLKIILPRLRIVNKSSLKKDAMISVIKTHFDENFETKLINGTIIYNTDNAFERINNILCIETLKPMNSVVQEDFLIKTEELRRLAYHFNIRNPNSYKKELLIDKLNEYILSHHPNETIISMLNCVLKSTVVKSNVIVKKLTNTSDIKRIIHLADLHIRYTTQKNGIDRYNEYYEVFNNLINMVKTIKESSLIVICGDIFHFKTSQKSSSLKLWNYLLYELTSLFPVIVITGNHDYDMESNNLDWIESSYECDNFFHLNETGIYGFNNLLIGISALKDDKILKMERMDNYKHIQLYHGTINDSKLCNNNLISSNITIDSFGEFDLLLLGDIHKYQKLKSNVAYSGSLIQQNIGESIYNHGFLLWDLDTFESIHYEVHNDYCFLKVYISDEIVFDTSIIGIKKKLYVIYEISIKNDSLIEEFEDIMNKNNIIIVNRRYRNNYNNISKLESNSVFNDKTTVEYFNDVLNELEYDNKDSVLNIHKSISLKIDHKDNFISKWNLDWVEFKNVFCYSNNIVNKIDLGYNGLYKIFGDNFTGKTSIFNIIKWVLFGQSSNVNEQDILNSVSEDGYISCSINNKYVLKKIIKVDKSLKSGIRIRWELRYENNVIVGRQEVCDVLNKIIGNYNEFELISSINNKDIGILVNNPYTIFKDLYKLDRFDDYLKESKVEIKLIKDTLSKLNEDIVQYDRSSPERLNKLIEDNKSYKSELSGLKLFSLESLKELEEELESIKVGSLFKINNDLVDSSDIITKLKSKLDKLEIKFDANELKRLKLLCNITLLPESSDYKCREKEINFIELDISNNLRELGIDNTNELHKHIRYANNISSDLLKDVSDDELYKYINKYRDLYKSIQNKISNCNKSISELRNDLFKKSKYSLDELEELKMKYDIIIIDKINKISDEEKIVDNYKSIIQNNLSKISIVNYSKTELVNLIREQGFDYENAKQYIINKINSETLDNSDYPLILSLINGINYNELLNQLNNNEKYRKDNKELSEKMHSSQLLINNAKDEINSFKTKIVNIDKRIKEINNNTKVNLLIEDKTNELNTLSIKSKEFNDKIKSIENQINLNFNNKLNDTIGYLNNLKELKSETKQYYLYKKNAEANIKMKLDKESNISKMILLEEYDNINNELNKYLKLHEDYLSNQKNIESNKIIESNNLKYQDLKNKIDGMKLKNSITQNKIDELETRISECGNEILTLTESIERNEKIMEEIISLDLQLETYNFYKKILTNNNIKNKMMNDKLNQLKIHTNRILDKYTNFNIDIEYNNATKITIYQIKNNKKISINSCSGYETMILNIACKIALKKYSSINHTDMLMIDEVMSCISTENHSIIDQLVSMITEYYNQVFIITHNNDIKDILNEQGKYINIKKIDNYSMIV